MIIVTVIVLPRKLENLSVASQRNRETGGIFHPEEVGISEEYDG